IDPGTPAERYQVVVHVDAPVLADPDAPGQSILEDGTHVSAETSRRLACDASRVLMRHGPDGRLPFRPGASHPSLGEWRPYHTFESRCSLSSASPRDSRRGLPGRATLRRRAALPPS